MVIDMFIIPRPEDITEPIHNSRGEKVSVAVNSSVTLINYTGAGCIEEIWMAITGAPNHLDGFLTFYIDNETPVDVDVGTLFLTHWSPGTQGFHALHVGSLVTSNDTAGWIRYPIHFQSGIKITFTAVTNPATIWWNILYKKFNSNTRRTKIASVRYIQNLTLAPGNVLTLVNDTGKGRLLATHLVLKSSDFTYLENNPTIVVDGEQIQFTGTEDFHKSGFYYIAGVQIGPTVGVISKNTTYYAVTQFRDFFGERNGIPYSSSLVIQYPNNESTVTINYSYVVIWEKFV